MIFSVILNNYRCYDEIAFEFSQNVNVIVGKNGVGKTCLLEAIFFLSTLRSPRTSREKELIQIGKNTTHISADFGCEEHQSEKLAIKIYTNKKHEITLNDGVLEKSRDLLGLMPSIFFSPSDLELLREGPSQRRKFIDMALCQISPKYTMILTHYKKYVDAKTGVLKQIEKKPSFKETMPEYNQKIAELSVQISKYRDNFVKNLNIFANLHHKNISGGKENLSIKYKTHVNNIDQVLSLINARSEAELILKRCLVGVHCDDFDSYLNEHHVKIIASQGQTRTASLALKLAERDIFKQEMGQTPILLLDDVLSELDEQRQTYILQNVKDGQLFITCCEYNRLPSLGLNELKNGKTIYINEK